MNETRPDDDNGLLSDLLAQWENLRAGGAEPSPQEICRDHPHLLGPFIEAIEKLKKADAAFGAMPLPPDPLPQQIGPYRILEVLGEGGMGTVYKAEQPAPLRRIVAVKVVKAGFDTTDVIARFRAEHQALARLDHPNIARVYDAGTTETGRAYFVMEYLPGQPITEFCDANKLSIRDRLKLFQQACEAINHAHIKAIVHRDIKSNNVLAFMQDGKPMVKVIDFGIAKALTGDRLTDLTFNTGRGVAVGTYYSMSPEQADGSADIDTRTDVYSLGVLLYELITGARPFDSNTLAKAADVEIRRIIRDVDPPRPSTRFSSLGDNATRIAAVRQSRVEQLTRELRGDLEWIPLKAMRKERNGRYASPLQMSGDIDNYLSGRPLIAGPVSQMYKFRKFAKRNARPLIALAASILLAVSAVAFYVHTVRAADVKLRAEHAKTLAEQANTQLALKHESEQKAIATANLAASNLKQAELAVQRGRWADAITAYAAARDAGSPEVQKILLGRVLSLQNLGKSAEGRKEMEDGIRAKPALADDPVVMVRRGELLWSTNPDEGERMLHKAMLDDLPDGERAFARGLLSDSIPGSIAQFKLAVAADPFRQDAIGLIAILSTILGQWQDADEFTIAWLRMFPDDPTARIVRSLQFSLRGDEANARKTLAASAGVFNSDTRLALEDAVEGILSVRRELAGSASIRADDVAHLASLLMATGSGSFNRSNLPFPKVVSAVVPAMMQGFAFRHLNFNGLAASAYAQAEKSLPIGVLFALRADAISAMDQHEQAAEEFVRAAKAPSPIDVAGLAELNAAMSYTSMHIARQQHGADAASDPRIAEHFRRAAELGALGSGTTDNCYYWKQTIFIVVSGRRTNDARALLDLWNSIAPDNPLIGVWEIENEYFAGNYSTALRLIKDLDRRYPKYDFAALTGVRDACLKAAHDGTIDPPPMTTPALDGNYTVPLRPTTRG